MNHRMLLLSSLSALLFAAPALAADLSLETPETASSSGLYLGIVGGYGVGTGDLGGIVSIDPVNPDTIDLAGYLLGVEAGVDMHAGGVVMGVVGDLSFTNITGDSCVEDGGCDVFDPDHSYLTATIDRLATLRARIGVDTGGALVYGTAGLAAADVSFGVNDLIDGNDFSGSVRHVGYAVGAGVQMQIAPNAAAGVEYLYVDLGEADYAFTEPVDLDLGPASITANILRGSVKMLF